MQLPTIVWSFGGDQLTNDSVYTIITEGGNHMIQNGGDSPRSSIRSVLTINHPNKTHEGTYFCSSSSSTVNVTLQVMNGRFALIINVAGPSFANNLIANCQKLSPWYEENFGLYSGSSKFTPSFIFLP